MAPMKTKVWNLLILLTVVWFTSTGCQSPTPSPTPTSPGMTLTPYQDPSPTATLSPTPILTSTAAPAVASPTPFIHKVKKGETLIGIAYLYEVSFDELISANPGLNPSQLSIGTEIVIPVEGGSIQGALPTPTAVPVSLTDPVCYPTNPGGLWCFTVATNNQESALENIAARINLHNAQGEIAARETAVSPLDILYPGESIPLSVRFSPPIPDPFLALGELLTSLAADQPGSRPQITLEDITYSGERLRASVQGEVTLPTDAGENGGTLWVLITAYDQQGTVVGFRKWISGESLQPGQPVDFLSHVYSLGPAIAEIDAKAEIH